jgi:hypothetical protein
MTRSSAPIVLRQNMAYNVLVVWAFFFGSNDDNRLKPRTVLQVGKKGGSMMVRGNLDQPFVRSKTAGGVRPGLLVVGKTNSKWDL